MAEFLKVPMALADQVVTYLAEHKWKDVVRLINGLSSSAKISEPDPPAAVVTPSDDLAAEAPKADVVAHPVPKRVK